MNSKVVYQTNSEGIYTGTALAHASPLEPGVFHLPAGCVEKEPPKTQAGQQAKWSSGRWYVSEEHKEAEPDAMQIAISLRQSLYRAESDPIKIEAEYDALISGSDPDYGPWKQAVQSIKDRVPLPTTAK